jgi:hypothetical protein
MSAWCITASAHRYMSQANVVSAGMLQITGCRFVEPDSPNAGESLTLYYNRKATNLANANIRDQDVSEEPHQLCSRLHLVHMS